MSSLIYIWHRNNDSISKKKMSTLIPTNTYEFFFHLATNSSYYTLIIPVRIKLYKLIHPVIHALKL